MEQLSVWEENQLVYALDQYNELRKRLGGIVLKFLLSFGFLAYITIDALTTDSSFKLSVSYILEYMLYSVVIYSLCSVFGSCVKITENYIIAIICAGISFWAFSSVITLAERIAGDSKMLDILLGSILWIVFLSPFILDAVKIIKMIRIKKVINRCTKNRMAVNKVD